MISTPDRKPHRRPGLALAAAGAALALGLAGAGLAEVPPDARALIETAREDIARADGIGAEILLRRAMARGAAREDVAALIGEAYMLQGNPAKAQDWLEPERFSPDTAAEGFRAYARLLQGEGDLAAAGRTFDRAIALTPKDATMWVEIGRLRYAGGQHVLALEAADYALKLDPRNVRALEFMGQIVRDQHGLVASLPWFEAALKEAPTDVSVLGDYAATLGDLDRAREMLAITRKMLDLDPGNVRAYYLQAVLAARAGNTGLARGLLARTGDALDDLPGAMLLEGVLEIRAGNYALAREALERLVKVQPTNIRARLLLARSMFLAGEYRELTQRFSEDADRAEASPYLLTLVGRAYEVLGQRDLAAPLLDRAAAAHRPVLFAVADSGKIGALLADGKFGEAEALAEQARAQTPGFYDSQAQAGDVQLAMGRGDAALVRYRLAARIRMPETLMLRMVAAMLLAGRHGDAVALSDRYLRNNPTSSTAARLVAQFAEQGGDWSRARLLLEGAERSGEGRDVELLSELSLAQLRSGDTEAAAATAHAAWRLQRASPLAAQVWGLSLATAGQDRAKAAALLEKARSIMGDTPLLAEGREKLAARG